MVWLEEWRRVVGAKKVATLGQKIALAEWLKSNQKFLDAQKASWNDAAALASKSLGTHYTEWHAKSVARECNITWARREHHGAALNTERLSALERRIAAIEDALGIKAANGHG